MGVLWCWAEIGGPGCHGTGSSPSGMGLRLDESSESDLPGDSRVSAVPASLGRRSSPWTAVVSGPQVMAGSMGGTVGA